MKMDCRGCCYPKVADRKACDCCEGVEPSTPLPTANRPGLSQLSYRIGSHASFLESMKARLSSNDFPRLAGLTTRDAEDLSIGLLDAWATVADLLTFYQERIANEGYLRSATERRSILELARLVGYKLRPGVSSSVFLAYNIDENTKVETKIPAGSRAQSVPGPDELPQSFETSEDLKARVKWNNLKPRMTQPQTPGTIANNPNGPRVYLKGINTNLKPNDPLLIDFGNGSPQFRSVKEVIPDAANNRTLILLETMQTSEMPTLDLSELLGALTLHPSVPPASSRKLTRKISEVFGTNKFQKKGIQDGVESNFGATEASHGVLKALAPQVRDTLATSLANAHVTAESRIRVYALRIKAAPFAHNAPLRPVGTDDQNAMKYSEWETKDPHGASGPDASFTTTINDRKVTFNNNSTGLIDSVRWNFGDGKTSVLSDPIHEYDEYIEYTVTLTVSGPGGSADQNATITLHHPGPF